MGGNAGPAHVDAHIYHLIAEGHYHRVAHHIDFGALVTNGTHTQQIEAHDKVNALLANYHGSFRKQGGLQHVTVLSRSVQGDKATIKVKLVFGNGQMQVSEDTLVRKNDRWLLVVS
jgi:hypothetical protein